ncbi:MAG: primosomal protein N' [Prevotella sp.]|nr:primosomal protein N' [Prevotella sp.]
MKYVDVILPLPLEGCFTYLLPDGMVVETGVRVVVPFGKNKTYVALVADVHDRKPEFDVKAVISVLDQRPVLLPGQLRLWHWISDYYMAPLGEVMNAALPMGMKVRGAYKPKTETYVGLGEKYRSEQMLHIALNIMSRASKQQKVFVDYLAMSHWDEAVNEGTVTEITRDELMNESHCTSTIVKQLVDRGFLYTYEKEVGRLNHGGEPQLDSVKKLNVAQTEAYNQILMQFMSHQVVLLHGVTSSGKTEIYIQLIKRALERKEQVLYLLPEIALTVQMRERLQSVFGNRLGIYHSKYSDAERVEIWQKQLSSNPYDVILGARSAVMLPFQRLGLVIVDEEHETSFKQQDPAPRYHARSVAIMMAAMKGKSVNVLLGTATPSMESYQNAQTGKYGLVQLMQRYKDIALPEIEVVDLKDMQRRKMMTGPFSPPLLAAMREALDRKEQIILFQNRRGFAPMVECKQCGWVPRCQHCDVSLTYHKNLGLLTCHYCGQTYQMPTECPCCGSNDLRGRGFGTEKIEDQVRELFPEARVARMDLDTTRTRNAYERLIGDFAAGRTHILIGTQMISKGLDFDRVSVVGILNADSMLNYPDFRAYEHAFMMMAQVSGRAGRKGKRGKVLLQTKNAQLPVITQVVRNDYEGFYNDLLEERLAFRYPPFYRLIHVYLKHKYEGVVDRAAIFMGGRLRSLFGERVLGPDKPVVAKVKTLNIRKIVLKLENGIDMVRVRQCLRSVEKEVMSDKGNNALQVFFDVDPL